MNKKANSAQHRNTVFNRDLNHFAEKYISKIAKPKHAAQPDMEGEKHLLRAQLFEQFMLFDCVSVYVDRTGASIAALIEIIGVPRFRELLLHNSLSFMIAAPQLFTVTGPVHPDRSKRVPIVLGSYTKEDTDFEQNIWRGLSYFPYLNYSTKKEIVKKAVKCYILPNEKVYSGSDRLMVDAYEKNYLADLGLPFHKDPLDLDKEDRLRLLDLASDVLETIILAHERFKSLYTYQYHTLAVEALKHIESGLKVQENTSRILEYNDLTDIQRIFIEEKISFHRVFYIRNTDVCKEYRNWVNDASVDRDFADISREFQDRIRGKSGFFNSTKGKFLKTAGVFGFSAAADNAMVTQLLSLGITSPPLGALTMLFGLGINLLDAHVLDGVLNKWKPGFFVDLVRSEIGEVTVSSKPLN
jgi:hypothetical protein